MPTFSRSDDWHQVSYTWGPGHVLISLRLNEKPLTDPEVILLEAIGTCNHGKIDSSKVTTAVCEALAAANSEFGTAYGCEAVRYVANDSPRYDRWAQGTRAIVQHLASGGSWATAGD